MDIIVKLFQLDIFSIAVSMLIILSGIVAVAKIIENFSKIIDKPVSWIKSNNEDHELLIKTAQNLDVLQQKHIESVKQSNQNDDMLRDKIQKLTVMFIDKAVDDMRYEILDFASSLSFGRTFSKEQFEHILSIHEKYERILDENNMSNGQVNTSMEVINELYKYQLIHGFGQKGDLT